MTRDDRVMRVDRGVSTVVDVGLCLLLVGAATLTLAVFVATDDDPTAARADRTAETVAATTVSVEYSLADLVSESETGAFDDEDAYDETDLRRVVHGPTGGLVADAAVANLSVDGERLTHAGVDFDRSLENATRGVLAGSSDRTEVAAVWRPYPNASLEGEARVGRTPPPDGDVRAAAMTVPSGLPAVRDDAVAAASGSGGDYEAVAEIVAEAVVGGYVPAPESQRVLESDGLERAVTANRYLRLATLVEGADPDDDAFRPHLNPVEADAAAANAYLIDRLATVVADDLEAETDTPLEAARSVSTGEVTLVVRTWRA